MFREYSFKGGGLVFSLQATATFDELIKAAGGKPIKGSPYVPSGLKTADNENFYVLVQRNGLHASATYVCIWNSKTNEARVVVTEAFPETKKEEGLEASDGLWDLTRYNTQHIF